MKWKSKYQRLLKKHRAYKGKVQLAVSMMSSPSVLTRLFGEESLGIKRDPPLKFEWFEREFPTIKAANRTPR